MPLRDAECSGAGGYRCPVAVAWITLYPSGKPMLIEIESLPPERLRHGLVLVNEATRKGQVLTAKRVESGTALRWMREYRMTLHRAHLSNKKCPRVKLRAGTLKPRQETM